MIVPRAYLYHTSKSGSPPIKEWKIPVRKSDAERQSLTTPVDEDSSTRPARLPGAFSPPHVTPSKPVSIPTRTTNGGNRRTRNEEQKGSRNPRKPPTRHDPTSIPPSTAALLAMTSIPEQGRRMATGTKPKSIDRRTKRARNQESPHHALSSFSPETWDFLLCPPEDHGIKIGSLESEAILSPRSSIRSISTESMPSLAEDEESISSSSNPGTPGLISGSNRSERRTKSLSTLVSEDCISDHPLLPTPAAHDLHLKQSEDALSIQALPPAQTSFKTSFKSNLTASFRAIRSAARSISDFTAAPIPQRDDYLSRSVLAIDLPFTDERRPLPSPDLPNPALRRYLNPITLSPAELHFHNRQEPASCRASIQLQSYQPGARRSSNASSPPVLLSNHHQQQQQQEKKQGPQGHHLSKEDALDPEEYPAQAHTTTTSPPSSLLPPRQREPRENSHFLRVIVLEMNMRKVGKLSDSAPGRARLWLPARQTGAKLTSLAAEVGAPAPPPPSPSSLLVDEKAQGSRDMGDGKKLVTVPRRWEGIRP
ncbi:MAG: hypothetical protein Q9217_002491 [Psora testacea]